MKKLKSLLLLCLALVAFAPCAVAGGSRIVELRCEYLTEPLGIDTPSPRFTWEYAAGTKFNQQCARVIVADNPDDVAAGVGSVWDFAFDGAASRAVYASSVPLQPYTRYYWKVFASDPKGKRAESSVASFETGKTPSAGWEAQWISDGGDKQVKPSPLFRRRFDASGEVARARLYISGLGYYEAWINGERVGDRLLDPGFTHFDKRVYYSVYDVTGMLDRGENVLAAVLGNGWFNTQTLAVWRFELARWRQRPMMLCELRIEYADGSSEVVKSDSGWKTSTGAYRFNNLYSGDVYDPNLEEEGWRLASFDDSHWDQAVVRDAPAPLVQAEMFAPIRATQEFKPAGFRKFSDRLYVYDFGQNLAGTHRIRVRGEKGTVVRMRAGEKIYPDGRLDRSNIDVYIHRENNGLPLQPVEGEEFQMDTYILKGGGWEEYTPSFNYHGFQYVEVESDKPVELESDGVTALFVHTDVAPVGTFSCSNETLNKIWRATNRSYLSNLHSIPTDCPQREKNGWTADGWVSIDIALLNFDGITLYEKWMRDFVDNIRDDGRISGIIPTPAWGYADWIGPVWDAAMFIIPQAIYQYYGDTRAIETIYPVCRKYLDFLLTREDSNGMVTYGIGDWLPYDTQTPSDFTTMCYYFHDYELMAGFAEVMGDDPEPYRRKAALLRDKINSVYLDRGKGIYSNGSIAAQAVPLYLGIVPGDLETTVAANLAAIVRSKGYIADFGLLGTKTVLRALTKYGYADDAYKMATQPDEPGWAVWVDKRGMTTLPERWIDDGKSDQSMNHVFFGDLSAWMYSAFAGINFDEGCPGFRHFTIRPHYVDGLDWARGEYDSVNGRIVSHWKRSGGRIELTVTVPPNTSATVYPGDGTQRELAGGTYKFKVKVS